MAEETTNNERSIGRLFISGDHQDLPSIKVLSGKVKGIRYEITGDEFTLGRDPKSNIVLNDKTISRRHAIIQKKGKRYYLVDLASKNGTSVNNIKITNKVLEHKDVIQIKKYIFQFTWD